MLRIEVRSVAGAGYYDFAAARFAYLNAQHFKLERNA
jgi:hypothetical protein